MEVPAPQAGTVKEVKVKAGDRVSMGDLIVVMEGAGAPAVPPKERITEAAAPSPGGGAPGYGSPSGVYESIEIKVPDIGDFKNVPVIEVHVQPGATISADDPLITLESDKATMEVPAPQGGTVKEVKVKVGDRVSQGDLIATLEGQRRAAPRHPHPAAQARTGGAAPRAGADRQAAGRRAGRLPRRGAGARRRARRLHGRVPRRRPRQEGGAGRALAEPRRRLPQRRLHPVQGAAARRQGHRRDPGHGGARHRLRRADDRHRQAARLEGRRGQEADRRPLGPRQAAQGHGRQRRTAASPPSTSSRSRATAATKTVSFEQAIIAAGSEPVTLPFIPHDDPRVIDSTGALELDGVPKRLLVIGGGIIGLEMATVYHALGTEVTIVELMDQIIPGADKDIVTPARQADLQALRGDPPEDQGHEGRGRAGRAARRTSRAATRRRREVFDKILVAVGRRPNGKLIGAENAGVAVDERGFIPVDKQMRTNVPHIFAIGDVVGQPMLAHKATHEGKVAAETAAGKNAFFDAKVIPSVAYTDPEVAWVGLTENEAKANGRQVRQGRVPLGGERPLAVARARRGRHQAAVRRGHGAHHRLRHRRPERGRPDRRGGAGDRDGRGRRRHRR